VSKSLYYFGRRVIEPRRRKRPLPRNLAKPWCWQHSAYRLLCQSCIREREQEREMGRVHPLFDQEDF
jgi:hypothetical protein